MDNMTSCENNNNNNNNNKKDDNCTFDDKVDSIEESKFINQYTQNKFSIWCSNIKYPSYYKNNIELFIVGSERIYNRLNISMDDFARIIIDKTLWYKINVEIGYDYQWKHVTYVWNLYISINDYPKMKYAYINWSYHSEYLKYINITVHGPSVWKFTEPQKKYCFLAPKLPKILAPLDPNCVGSNIIINNKIIILKIVLAIIVTTVIRIIF